LVGSDLLGNDSNLKIGLFGQTISLKSALSDFKPGKHYGKAIFGVSFWVTFPEVGFPDFSL
jgi:hypothetical protein